MNWNNIDEKQKKSSLANAVKKVGMVKKFSKKKTDKTLYDKDEVFA